MQVTQSGPGPDVGVLRPCTARETTGVAAYDGSDRDPITRTILLSHLRYRWLLNLGRARSARWNKCRRH
jgi:hypothetical protein